MPNRLLGETSPYLLQHAHNPVDWYPWGEEALERARKEDKPILLSIGYAACHWCHVMERECFENPEIALLMNELFISIKVDREERPDIDAVYMEAVQAMTGGGGWPLTVFLSPDGKAFFGGTYFPPRDISNQPGFPRVLLTIAEAYRGKRAELAEIGEQVLSHVKQGLQAAPAGESLAEDTLARAYHGLRGVFDHENGGLGGAPKFPQPLAFEFLLRWNYRARDRQALDMVEQTLVGMARGGIYDQMGGGFHRYATDARWLVPHFEKMLYDNALLGRLYLYAYQVTGKPFYRRIVEETVDYVLREMAGPTGGYCSSQDADTEGVEGKFYVWTHEEIHKVLGESVAPLVCRYFGVTGEGNFEGGNVLHISRDLKDVAVETGMEMEEAEGMVQKARKELLAARGRRSVPARDDKVLTSWNGLMLQTLAECAGTLGRDDYRQAAAGAADFLLREMRVGGKLMHSYKDGKARIPGYLEDYASLAGGLLAVHAAGMQRRWLEESLSLVDSMLELFWDEGEGVFFDTGRENESLLVRPRRLFDSPVPSGSAAVVNVLLQMAVVTGEDHYRERAVAAMSKVAKFMTDQPAAFGAWLCGLDFHLAHPREIVLVGPSGDPRTRGLLAAIHGSYLPHKVVLAVEPGEMAAPERIRLLQGRVMKEGKPTAFVCRDHACQSPTTRSEDLKVQLEG